MIWLTARAFICGTFFLVREYGLGRMISRAIEERFALYYPDTSHDGAAIRQLANTASLADLPSFPAPGVFC